MNFHHFRLYFDVEEKKHSLCIGKFVYLPLVCNQHLGAIYLGGIYVQVLLLSHNFTYAMSCRLRAECNVCVYDIPRKRVVLGSMYSGLEHLGQYLRNFELLNVNQHCVHYLKCSDQHLQCHWYSFHFHYSFH